ncbi:MAG: SAM-dependent methyltransferase [Polyangiales bacterium]
MSDARARRAEFGDFQTPLALAREVCGRLARAGFAPDVIVEPTCGVGAFLIAAAEQFPNAKTVLGFELNQAYLDTLAQELAERGLAQRVRLEQADFFATDWAEKLRGLTGSVLVVGNFPWVTNSAQTVLGGSNLPRKSNFQGRSGYDAISGSANFDVSEWMLLEVLRWFERGDVAMLIKTHVARKVLAQRQVANLRSASIAKIDAKKHFHASVEACLLTMRLQERETTLDEYTVFEDLGDQVGERVGHRDGLTVRNLDVFERVAHLTGQSPQKWRSGVKHDAASVMELRRGEHGLQNGQGSAIELEDEHLFPLLKGSDIGSNKAWRGMYVLVPQRRVGQETASLEQTAPKTWAYLARHGEVLDARRSVIYSKNPRFSVFGVGDYTFRPWRIAICGLYKTLRFRLVPPIDGRPVMFDDTVYYLSFDTEEEASDTFARLTSPPATELLSSLIFWDDKRPIKTSVLNVLDWSRIELDAPR